MTTYSKMSDIGLSGTVYQFKTNCENTKHKPERLGVRLYILATLCVDDRDQVAVAF
jgi:hypothetical protein